MQAIPPSSVNHHIVILSAPSGAGKGTLATHLFQRFPLLTLSVSATTRPLRGEEQHGREYYFVSHEVFERLIEEDAFVEWEEVYQDIRYGTLHCELERIWELGRSVLFDVDVKGGIRLKQIFGAQALSIFIQPPSLEVLKERLEQRGVDTPESIQKRMAKAEEEMSYAPHFDVIIINDVLEDAKQQIEAAVEGFV